MYIRRHEGLLNILWTFNLRTAGRGCLSVKNTEHNIFQSFQGHNCEAQLQTEQRRSIRIHVKSRVETYSKPTETSKMNLSAKIVNGFQSFTIFAKVPSYMFEWVL